MCCLLPFVLPLLLPLPLFVLSCFSSHWFACFVHTRRSHTFSLHLYSLSRPSITIFYHIKNREKEASYVDDYVFLSLLSLSISINESVHVSLWWWQFVFEIAFAIITIIIYTTRIVSVFSLLFFFSFSGRESHITISSQSVWKWAHPWWWIATNGIQDTFRYSSSC